MQPEQRRRGRLGDDDTQVIRKLPTTDGEDGAPPIYMMENTHRTPHEWRAFLLLAGVVAGYVLLGRAQPHAESALAFRWSVVALATSIGCGLVAIFIPKAEGLRRVVMTFQLLSALAVVILDSLYWVRLVLH